MLLQRLREYAEERMSLPPPMYSEQAIRYFLSLRDDGTYLGCRDTASRQDKALKNGIRMLAPHAKRAVGIRPKLLADNAQYVLGVAGEGNRPERVQQQHEQFVALVNACSAEIEEPSVEAVATFLNNLDVAALELPADFDPAATISFEVGPEFERPIDLRAVKSFWAATMGPDEEGEATVRLPCIACGNIRPVLERHPLKIKGVPGGQILKDLISANEGAFESYGLTASLIAPTCQPCAEAYGNALNALLANRDTSLWMKESAYAFWTREPTVFNMARLLSEPENRQTEVKSLLSAHLTGKAASVYTDENAFYAVGLGASGARLVVRDWIDTTVSEAQRRIGRYFALQELVGWNGSPWEPASIARLSSSTVHNPKKDEPLPIVSSALVRLATNGDPLPLDLLYLAVQRNRAKQGVNRERAMLIKMVLVSQPDVSEGEDSAMSRLNPTHLDEAYHCGRLLQVLDEIQYAALGKVNASVIDKFYGAASAAPASVFGTLIHNAQNHLGKLRGDSAKRGAYIALDKKLTDVMGHIAEFPPTLSLPRQGVFALGFYHQRAERFGLGPDGTFDGAADSPTA